MERSIYFCACNDQRGKHAEGSELWRQPWRQCDPQFMKYGPQDIAKGTRIAQLLGYPEGTWAPYKICGSCARMGCVSQYTTRAIEVQDAQKKQEN